MSSGGLDCSDAAIFTSRILDELQALFGTEEHARDRCKLSRRATPRSAPPSGSPYVTFRQVSLARRPDRPAFKPIPRQRVSRGESTVANVFFTSLELSGCTGLRPRQVDGDVAGGVFAGDEPADQRGDDRIAAADQDVDAN
jgi:hypothetical protein